MTEFENISFDERLEAYLDGVMPEGKRAEFEKEITGNPRLAAEVALQARLDASLLRTFPVAVPSAPHIHAMAKHLESAASNDRPVILKGPWQVMGSLAAIVAAACVVFALWSFGVSSPQEPYFEPLPVAGLYAQTVAEGFEPYYECRDDERFAKTFADRQGIALRLTKMPLGSMMKGLSYPGGLSRETTAVLCDVNGQPVMVFVDREQSDQSIAAKNNNPKLNVFRTARDGLVFYEVTPLAQSTMTEHLVLTEN